MAENDVTNVELMIIFDHVEMGHERCVAVCQPAARPKTSYFVDRAIFDLQYRTAGSGQQQAEDIAFPFVQSNGREPRCLIFPSIVWRCRVFSGVFSFILQACECEMRLERYGFDAAAAEQTRTMTLRLVFRFFSSTDTPAFTKTVRGSSNLVTPNACCYVVYLRAVVDSGHKHSDAPLLY